MSGLVLNKNKKAFDDYVDFIFLPLFATHIFCQPVLTGKNQWLKPLFAATCQPCCNPLVVVFFLR